MTDTTQTCYSTGESNGTSNFGVSAGEREEILLDELRVEIARLADAVERQNELLEAGGQEVEQ